MILIPELELVVILVPRTGSGSLRHAIAERYPQSMLLYRHMEASGVPVGYDRWPKVGLIRNPVARMWSLYNFMRTLDGPYDSLYIEKIRASVQRPFDDWLINNEVVFTEPHSLAGAPRVLPRYMVAHSLPENRKSQFHYLRPDLGTEIVAFEYLHEFAKSLDLNLAHFNNTGTQDVVPDLSEEAAMHCCQMFGWDFKTWLECRRVGFHQPRKNRHREE